MSAHAQIQVQLEVNGIPMDPALGGRDAAQSVYVRDSAIAVEKLALAQRLEHLKEWDKSADVYMEILRGYPDRVVPALVDPDNKIYQYKSVASAVQERLAKWPEPGLQTYRARYAQDADALLAEAGDDAVKLHQLVWLYLPTDSAKQAGMRLIDLYFENGDFAAAAWLGQTLLARHPTLGEDRPGLMFRTALAEHLCGESEQAKAQLEQLKKDHPDAVATVRGVRVNLAQTLEKEIAKPQASIRATTLDSWRSSFGSDDRAHVPQASGAFGARVYAIEMPKTTLRSAVATRAELEALNNTDRAAGAMTGVLPVVDRGEMFFHDNARVYAVNLESGTPLPGWSETYGGEQNGLYALPAWSTPRGFQSTLAVTDDSVFAVMALTDIAALQYTGAANFRGDSRLVCLDRRTGKEKWVASSRSLPAEAGFGRNLDFSGCPIVAGDTVYVMGRGGKGAQFEDSYVLAFDAATGKSKWICYLASASAGMMEFGDFSTIYTPRVAQLSYWGGRLYALSNLGALAAIDANNGNIVWLNLYPRDVPDMNRANANLAWRARGRNRVGSDVRPWNFSPVIVSGGKVFILPADGLHALVYDASTGVEHKRIALSQLEDAQTMLGVVDEKLVLASNRTIYCVNWPAYDPTREASGNLVWRTVSFSKSQYPDESIRGRGFVTQEAVIVPTAWGLHRISLGTGRHEAMYPARDAEWGDDEGPGNILVTQDRLIVAGPERLNVYTDMTLAMAKLDAEVAAAPQQPEPRLRYAEVMSVAGQWDLAGQKLDEAMGLLSGIEPAAAASARDRLFNDALGFAQRVAKEDESTALAAAFFDRAAAAAHTPPQQVMYRLTRARVAKGQLSPEDELKLYQEIVEDPQLRDVTVASDPRGARPAGAVAERAINELIARSGRDIYASYEASASQRVQDARAANQPEAFVAISRQYPNAKAAPQALRLAADAYESQGNPRLAAQMLRLLLFKYPDTEDRPGAIEALARNYLALPNRAEVAIARLAQGARIDGARLSKPLKLPDGTVLENVSFAEALAALREVHGRSAASALPDMNLPPLPPADKFKPGQSKFLPPTPESTIERVTALVLPLREFTRNDRVVAFVNERGVCAFEIGSNQPLFASDALSKAPKGAAWLASSLLVWNDQELAALDPQKGHLQWKTMIGTLPDVPVATEGAVVEESIDAGASAGGGLPIVRGDMIEVQGGPVRIQGNLLLNRRARALQAAGLAQPQPQLAAEVLGPEQITLVRPLSDRVLFCTSSGRVASIDLEDGRLMWQTRPSESTPSHFLASDDFVALRVQDGAAVSLLVLDALSGQFLGRRNFNNDNGAGLVPINLALAADGTLVWILPDRICGKDLFEPGDRLTFEVMGRPDRNASVFAGATGSDHLQICDGRIFVLSEGGTQVRVYSLETGKALRSGSNDIFLATGARSWNALVRPLGRRLYVVGSNVLYSYDLENLAFNWATQLDSRTSIQPRDVIVAQNYVIVVAEPVSRTRGGNRPLRPATALRLIPVSRAPLDNTGRETGLLDEKHPISEPSSVQAWQPVTGGFYYLSGDQKLHFLQGAGSGQSN